MQKEDVLKPIFTWNQGDAVVRDNSTGGGSKDRTSSSVVVGGGGSDCQEESVWDRNAELLATPKAVELLASLKEVGV